MQVYRLIVRRRRAVRRGLSVRRLAQVRAYTVREPLRRFPIRAGRD
jgi:hypothetical protein